MKLHVLLICILLVIAAAESARTQVITFEAEDYTDSHDIGGTPISIQTDPGCSGGLYLVGLDLPGEWTAYAATVDTFGVYAPRIWCRGDIGVEYQMRLAFEPDSLGGSQTVDFFFTGIGYG